MKLPFSLSNPLEFMGKTILPDECLPSFNIRQHQVSLAKCLWLRDILNYKRLNQHFNWINDIWLNTAVHKSVPSLASLAAASIHYNNTEPRATIQVTSPQVPPTLITTRDTFNIDSIKRFQRFINVCIQPKRNFSKQTIMLYLPVSFSVNFEPTELPQTLHQYLQIENESKEWITRNRYWRYDMYHNTDESAVVVASGDPSYIWFCSNSKIKINRRKTVQKVRIPDKWLQQIPSLKEIGNTITSDWVTVT